ncbi:uncharacterized protein LOC134993401 isoform X3 [Pseudophryne corroboree]|uniref:uncharacterized protein LOC134993401 isoform X3 n=1 Tax=Pseudophryne corroboree TaxID=495146 RepID=UPI003081FB75
METLWNLVAGTKLSSQHLGQHGWSKAPVTLQDIWGEHVAGTPLTDDLFLARGMVPLGPLHGIKRPSCTYNAAPIPGRFSEAVTVPLLVGLGIAVSFMTLNL